MDSDIISVLMKAVFPVLVNRLTWGLLLCPWWLKTPSSLRSPCRFRINAHILHVWCCSHSSWTYALSRVNPLVQTKFGGTVKGESAMVNTSDIGSLVEFTFDVSHFIHSDYIRPLALRAPRPHFFISTLSLELLCGCMWKKLSEIVTTGWLLFLMVRSSFLFF